MQRQIMSIQVVRAIAILMVLLVHVSAVTRAFNPAIEWGALAFGSAGVDLFFVISGFIICLVTEKREANPGVFLVRRALRIYPFYAFFTLIWFGMSAIAGRGEGGLSFLIISLAILPQEQMPYLFVGWSLEHELIFYGLVAFLLALGRPTLLIPLLLGLWGVGLLNSVLLPTIGTAPFWDFHLFSLYHLDFALGVLIYQVRDRIVFRHWPVVLILGLLAFPAIMALLGTFYPDGHVPTQGTGIAGLVRVVLFGAASAAVVTSLISAESTGWLNDRLLITRSLNKLGDASFSLYLMHHLVFAVVAFAVAKLSLPGALSIPVAAVSIVLAIALSLVWYDRVEKPFLRWSSGHHRKATTEATSAV